MDNLLFIFFPYSQTVHFHDPLCLWPNYLISVFPGNFPVSAALEQSFPAASNCLDPWLSTWALWGCDPFLGLQESPI